MKISLDEKHYLNSDRFCYWITCKYDAKGKKAERRVSGYMPSYGEAVESFIEGKFNSSAATKLVHLKRELEEIKETVRKWENQNEKEKD